LESSHGRMTDELYYRIILFIIIRRLNYLLLLVVWIRYLDGLRDTVIIIIEDCFVKKAKNKVKILISENRFCCNKSEFLLNANFGRLLSPSREQLSITTCSSSR
jgi:hypothetical protein